MDPVYFDKTYYLAADTNASKAYALLREVLAKSKKIGIAKITIRVLDNHLVLETLHFPDGVRSIRLLVGNDHSYTRHGTITTSRFPELIFGGQEVLIDGELITPGTNAPDDLAGSMSRFSGNKKQSISLMGFDVLSYENKSVIHLPLEERKAILTESLAGIDSPYINLIPYVYIEGAALFEVMKEKVHTQYNDELKHCI